MMVVRVGSSGGSEENNHNGAAHQALCDVLKGAVGMWGKNGEHLSEPLRGALAHTIFGKDGTRNLDALIGSDVPDDYKKGILGSSRVYLCGLTHKEKEYGEKLKMRFSGHSAPHDLLCVCTPGTLGWPLTVKGSETIKDKLCGQEKDAFLASGEQELDRSGNG
ncbi:unnamed protein product [Trypanosoma congolense IL3000]|uniref:WGS project CAEQ00000000 data, annotated contig 1317 n=1 Tax=Trypanosoma congolense (strain IL3000) TaxID=1068625 RepID=F9W5D9_TRYCI|nr:unnamed protein product [Trypanosoma congolense IL3000]